MLKSINNIRPLTREEVNLLYNVSTETKLLRIKELEDKHKPTQEEFNKFFEERIFSTIDTSKNRFIKDSDNYDFEYVKMPTSRIQLRNSKGHWLFDYDYNQKTPHFYYSHYLVRERLTQQFLLTYDEIQILMKTIVEKYFNLYLSIIDIECFINCDQLDNSMEEAKAFMLSKFNKDELEYKSKPTQEEFNAFFEENILCTIDYSKTKFLDCAGFDSKTPTSRIELRNSNNDWLFDYDYNKKNIHFYYSYYHVYIILNNKFSLTDVDIAQLMKSMVNKHFNLHGVTPCNTLNIGIEEVRKSSYGV
jgi:hypothetical protein